MPRQATHPRGRFLALAAALAVALAPQFASAASVDCQAARSNTELSLYLYFPNASDSDYPADINGTTTGPIPAFDAADLDAAAGSTSEYRDAITRRVKLDYCELDVAVSASTSPNGTTNPTPSDDRWRVVGIGGDAFTTSNLYGKCCTNGIARVWAGEFGEESEPGGAIDGTLTGANSTLVRWANAIAGTVSHEAGHSLGTNHQFSVPRPNEDARGNHLMASGKGAGNITGEDRASDRHFSDNSLELLAANLGFYEKTLSNWDFVNPNPDTADGLTVTVFVAQDAGEPEIGSVYDGSLSPWSNAEIASSGIGFFNGTAYDSYDINFTDPQDWDGGGGGEVGGGVTFHVGVGLSTNYIVRDVRLTSGGTELGLQPRVIGYTPDGSFNPETGDYHLTLSVPDAGDGPLVVSNVQIRHLPRTLAINEMVDGGASLDASGRPILPWALRDGATEIPVDGTAELAVANLAEPRALDLVLTAPPDCGMVPEILPVPDSDLFDITYCDEGRQLGLFPSARVYVAATVTDPDATFFDRKTGEMVTGPLSSRIFIQFPGGFPDLNDNGVDDAIDIDTGVCTDINRNGVCDDAEPTRYAYPAKIICGRQDVPNDGRLVRGDYATTVNILNPSDRRARITKTLSLTFPPDEQRPGLVAPIATETLPAQSALKVDCADIASTVFGGTLPAPYVEGYVTVESATRLDVTGVYSSRDLAEAPPCDTGAGRCGRDSCKGPTCCGDSCKPAPSVSTTLDVVPAREILRPPPRRPALCPDLVVTDIGRPQVTCPSAQGSCVTRLDYIIGNIGTAASGPFQARASADPDQGKTAVEQIESLLPGQDISISVLTTSGGNCFDPDCTLTVEADSKGKVKECREDNNSRTETTPG